MIDNPDAFPTPGLQGNDNYFPMQATPGMSLRDYFAAKAMQGLLASDINDRRDEWDIATVSYAIADAMLAERDRTR